MSNPKVNEDSITVLNGTDPPMILPIECNTLSMECLQTYFPNANGLVWSDETGNHGLQIKNGQMTIIPEIRTYKVRWVAAPQITADASNVTSSSSSTANMSNISGTLQAADKAKIDRVNFYRKVIEGKVVGAMPPIMPKVNKPPEAKEEKYKISDIRKVQKQQTSCSAPKIKHINVGWKHKTHGHKKYLQRKNIKNGNSKELPLELNKIYTVDDIIKLGIQEFNDDQVAKLTLENSDVNLGFYNGSIIEQFYITEGTECGLWDYLAYHNVHGRINLYLYSTEKEYSIEESSESQENEKAEHSNKEFADNIPSKKRKVLSNITNTVSSPIKDDKNDAIIASEALLQLSNSTKAPANGIVPEIKISPDNSNNSLQATPITFDRIFRVVDVYYAVISTSKYSKEKLFSDQDKTMIFFDNVQNEGFSNIDKENFDPVDSGYDISKIVINEHEILTMKYNEMATSTFYTKSYSLPQLEKIEPHMIAYDIDDTLGSYDEYLGIGVIPTCLPDCKPEFTWYRNNVMHKKLKMAFWLQIPKSTIDTEWYCHVTCKEKGTLQSKKVLIKANILENSTVSEVQRSEFTIGTFIGAGSTANIFKGTFSNMNVAVKSIKVFPRYKKMIDREISVLKKIKHDNLIQLMAYCKEEKKVHLIMEYFDGKNLSELIFDEDLKEAYVFDKERKDSIFLQLSHAIEYLHGQSNPIIHKDIKSENILINLSGKVKLCDFGLSKFSIMITTLQSTCNSKVMGTKMYMAPEILLLKRDATEKSDIWSLACTILEIYKEDVIWDIQSEEELINVLKNYTVPDIGKIPDEYKDIIKRCFSYDRENRPSMMHIIEVLNEIYMQTIRSYQSHVV